MQNYELKGLRSILISRLLPHIGPLAHVIVDEAISTLKDKNNDNVKLSAIHIVAVLRQLHAELPSSVDSDAVISGLREELLLTHKI